MHFKLLLISHKDNIRVMLASSGLIARKCEDAFEELQTKYQDPAS